MARTGKTPKDWVLAGQQLLMDGGIEAIKLHRLTELLAVSTGSFYHHFRSFDDYLSALAHFYGTEQAQLIFDQAREAVGDDPDLRLREATGIFGRSSMRQLNIAMRAWAHQDERALAAVRRYDEVLMANLDQIFLDLGFDELAAKSRTLIMLGLASLDVDENLSPSFQERWPQIRDLILTAPEQLLSEPIRITRTRQATG
ncbi:MAG: TetR/AcrR family transcriptional regulator [Pseudomonadota bacterium]